MKRSVYLESSLISYYSNKRSRDLVCAARQIITQKWWQTRLKEFEGFVSPIVLEEIARGNQAAAEKRLETAKAFVELRLSQSALDCAEYLLRKKAVPRRYPEDALHISIAAVNGIDYLVTWNFSHINNAERKLDVERAVREYGFEPPVICTPEELMGEMV
jgi:predicted nucleic acid-binding protein